MQNPQYQPNQYQQSNSQSSQQQFQQPNNQSGYQQSSNQSGQQSNNQSGYQQSNNQSGQQFQQPNSQTGYQQQSNNQSGQQSNNQSGYQQQSNNQCGQQSISQHTQQSQQSNNQCGQQNQHLNNQNTQQNQHLNNQCGQQNQQQSNNQCGQQSNNQSGQQSNNQSGQQQNQKPVLSEERVKSLTSLFKQYDQQKQGSTNPSNFNELIKSAGYNLSNPRSVENMRNFFVNGNDFTYYEFMSAITFLQVTKEHFEQIAQGGKIPNNQIQQFLKANGYIFKDRMANACIIVADRENTGSFDFTGAVGLLIYLQFVNAYFTQADANGDGKLQYNELRPKFEYLGVGQINEETAIRIFKEADSDNSGAIDRSEFVELVIRLKFPERFQPQQQQQQQFNYQY